jgi:hypothetical protein
MNPSAAEYCRTPTAAVQIFFDQRHLSLCRTGAATKSRHRVGTRGRSGLFCQIFRTSIPRSIR